MASAPLTKEQVAQLSAADVHKTLQRVMLADGMDFVADWEKSKGSWFACSKSGEKYLDFFSFFASLPVGHNHPKMVDPAWLDSKKHLLSQNPSNSDIYSQEMAQFVATFERVCMPKEMSHVFFVSGGGLAVENALKAAFDWKCRINLAKGKGEKGMKIMHFKSCFHGRTGYTMSLTNTDPIKIMYFPKFDWPRIENPKCVFPLEGENLKAVIEAEKRSVAQMEEIFKKDADDIAAIIIETVQGEGGDNHFRPEFLKELRRLADQYEAMLIFDEVQCGMGLTGSMWAWQRLGTVPDMVCFGKKSQVCGFMANARIDPVKDNVFQLASRINSTWGGNLCDMVRAHRMYEIIEEEHLVENSRDVGAYLLEGLHSLEKKHKILSNARGMGLMCAFDLPTKAQRDNLRTRLAKKFMLVLACGDMSIRFRPTLTTTKEDVDIAIKRIDEAVAEMA